MMVNKFDRQKLEAVFDSAWSPDELENYSQLRELFVFHLQEAAGDVLQLADLIRNNSVATDELGERLYCFFLHALPHLLSAGQIYDTVPDTFPEQHGVHQDKPAIEPTPAVSISEPTR